MKFLLNEFKPVTQSTLTICCIGIGIWGGMTACTTKTRPTHTYAYITNSGNNSVFSCQVNGASLDFCADSTAQGLKDPEGITISNGYAFIVNAGNNSITSCVVNGAVLTSCTTMTNAQLNNLLDVPSGITIDNGYAYITNYVVSGKIISCSVNNGTLTACLNSGASSVDLHFPAAIAISDGYAYITNDNAYITSCRVNGGTLSACQDTNLDTFSIDYDEGNAIVIDNDGYAFFTSEYGVYTCQVNAGILSHCSSTALSAYYFYGLTIYNGYLFVLPPFYANGLPISCQLNDNTLSACKLTGISDVVFGGDAIAIN